MDEGRVSSDSQFSLDWRLIDRLRKRIFPCTSRYEQHKLIDPSSLIGGASRRFNTNLILAALWSQLWESREEHIITYVTLESSSSVERNRSCDDDCAVTNLRMIMARESQLFISLFNSLQPSILIKINWCWRSGEKAQNAFTYRGTICNLFDCRTLYNWRRAQNILIAQESLLTGRAEVQ